MLIQLRVENHRSVRDEQVLSMVAAAAGAREDARLLRPAGLGEALLPAVALYGANASGKSNVLAALGFMRDAVLRSHRLWEPEGGVPQEPFALSSRAGDPSLYEVDVLVGGVRYRYGFVLSASRVEEEWLHAWPQGRKQAWLTREGDDFDFSRNLGGENEAIRGLTRPNSLFLSAAAQNNHAALSPIFAWFRATRLETSAGRSAGMSDLQMEALHRILSWQLSLFPDENVDRERERDTLVHLVRAADVGVEDLRVERRDALAGFSVPGPSRAPLRKRFEIHLRHKTNDPERAWLPLAWESAGTVTLLGIATRLVGVLRAGSLLCVDELEASLHPMLALEILRLFHDPAHNPRGAQLVFTTHDTNLLGNALARRRPARSDLVYREGRGRRDQARPADRLPSSQGGAPRAGLPPGALRRGALPSATRRAS